MIIGGLFVGRPLMTLIAGADFVVLGDLIKVLLIATGSIFIAGLFGYAIVALGEQKRMIKFNVINAILSVIGYLIFIPRYGYWGAAWMTVASELLILITALWVIKKTLGFTPSLNRSLRVLAASGVMALILYFIPTQNVFLLTGAGMFTYGIALFAFKGVDRALVSEILSLRTS